MSRWTVHRRVKELGIEDSTGYSDISDDELDSLIRDFKNMHGISVGRSLVIGYLKSFNIRVQQHRVVKSLVRIDPVNSRIRWSRLVEDEGTVSALQIVSGT